MPASPLKRWIARSLRQDPPRAKSLVMTVFGDAIAPYGGSAWLGSLIALLTPLDVSERLVRTSVFRLVEEGWLEASRSGRRSQYSLSELAEQRFMRAHQRVYAPVPSRWDQEWLWLNCDAAAFTRTEKLRLKKALMWEGFAEIAAGTYAYPGVLDAEARLMLKDVLERSDAAAKVFVIAGKESAVPGTLMLADRIEDVWPLKEVRKNYRLFIKQHEPLLEMLGQEDTDSSTAFCIRTLLIHAYRRVQLHDPQLPAELLGADWPGNVAHVLCRDIYQHITQQAERHISSTLAAEQEDVPIRTLALSQRFSKR